MKRKVIPKIVFATLVGSLCMLQMICFPPSSSAADVDVIVIANKNVEETSIKKNQLKNIFLGKVVSWPDKNRIVLATMKSGAGHKKFLKKYIGKTKSQYTLYFKSLFFAGKGKMPKRFSSEESLIEFVANTDGAIGYISKNAGAENVKIIKVN